MREFWYHNIIWIGTQDKPTKYILFSITKKKEENYAQIKFECQKISEPIFIYYFGLCLK